MIQKLKERLQNMQAIGIQKIFSASPGASLSALERFEQLNKHGFDLKRDAELYKNGELVKAAAFCMGYGEYPVNWDEYYKNKILSKTKGERMIIASAFLCAEFDRLSL